jgi:hypothetical protein
MRELARREKKPRWDLRERTQNHTLTHLWVHQQFCGIIVQLPRSPSSMFRCLCVEYVYKTFLDSALPFFFINTSLHQFFRKGCMNDDRIRSVFV